MPLTLYHRTTHEAGDAILAEGFRDATGTYLTRREHTGVWVSDQPLDANEGALGDTLLEIALGVSEEDLSPYEWVEDGKAYREWLVPAAMLNAAAVVTIIDREPPALAS